MKTFHVLFLVRVLSCVIYIATPHPIGLNQAKTGNGSILLFSPHKLAAAWEPEFQSLGNLIYHRWRQSWRRCELPSFHATGPERVIPRVRGCV